MNESRIETHSATWLEIEHWAKARIDDYTTRLKVKGMPLADTEGLRYAIAELEGLLKLPNPSNIPMHTHLEPDL